MAFLPTETYGGGMYPGFNDYGGASYPGQQQQNYGYNDYNDYNRGQFYGSKEYSDYNADGSVYDDYNNMPSPRFQPGFGGVGGHMTRRRYNDDYGLLQSPRPQNYGGFFSRTFGGKRSGNKCCLYIFLALIVVVGAIVGIVVAVNQSNRAGAGDVNSSEDRGNSTVSRTWRL